MVKLSMMKLWNCTWFSFLPIKTRSSMSVLSWSYQKDGKRSLNKMENISFIKGHSLYLKQCVLFVWKNRQLLLGQPNKINYLFLSPEICTYIKSFYQHMEYWRGFEGIGNRSKIWEILLRRDKFGSSDGDCWREMMGGVNGERLNSAARNPRAHRESRDAPFHSQTADIANPFPKYLIPKRLELRMDYKPIYYFPVRSTLNDTVKLQTRRCDVFSPPFFVSLPPLSPFSPARQQRIVPFGRILKEILFQVCPPAWSLSTFTVRRVSIFLERRFSHSSRSLACDKVRVVSK